MTQYEKFSEAGSENNNNNRKRRRWMIAAAIILGILLLICIIVLVLALTLFNIKNPKIELVSATINGAAPHFSLSNFHIQFNLSLDLQIRVDNPNPASFHHETGKTLISYRDSVVGEMNISSGFIPSKGSENFQCRLGLTFDPISSDTPQLFMDAQSGRVVIVADTKIPGRVSFMGGLIKRDAVGIAKCNLTIGIPDVKIVDGECESHSKL